MFYLEDFDLAAGGVDMLHVFPVLVRGESVDLDSEGHPLLPAMLPGSELSADTVDLRGRVVDMNQGGGNRKDTDFPPDF